MLMTDDRLLAMGKRAREPGIGRRLASNEGFGVTFGGRGQLESRAGRVRG